MVDNFEKLQKENDSIKAENKSLIETQQSLKAEIKKLTESTPKITSGHKVGSIKYKRQKRTKS